MGVVKKVLKATTGIDLDAKKKAREAEEAAKAEADRQAALAAEQANVAANTQAGTADTAQADPTQAVSTKKKKLKEGRKGLSVSRSSGAGINL